MDWWTEVALATSSFLDRHGLLAAFVILLIEEAGVPVPVPGDFLMLVLGVQARARNDPWMLVQVIAAMELATVLGATALYYAARLGGRGIVYRYGRFMRMTPERLDKAEHWLQKHGTRAVFLGRLVPGLRIVTAVACGVFMIPPRVFFPAMALGALLYIVVYTMLGYFFGPPVLSLLERVHLPIGLIGSLLPLAVIVLWTMRARQGLGRRVAGANAGHSGEQLRAGAVAGGLATVASTSVLNVLLNLAGNVAFNAPGTIVERTADRLAFAIAREVEPSLLLIVIVAYLAVGVLWGALYAVWGDTWLPHQPDWVRGLVYASVPLAASAFIAMPIVGLGFLGIGATGPVALMGEMIRHATYGMLLALMYPVLRVRRNVRVLPHTPDELSAESAV